MCRLFRSRRSSMRGFTLMEIMIVVAIVGVLAALAVPAYRHNRFRAKTAEVRTTLGAIRAAQDSFYAEIDAYAHITALFPPLPVAAYARPWVGAPPCDPTCNRLNPANCTQFECIRFQPVGQLYYGYVTPTNPPTRTEFAIAAVGDVDGNTVLASFTWQSSNGGTGLGVVPDGVSACIGQGVGYPAGQYWECVPNEW